MPHVKILYVHGATVPVYAQRVPVPSTVLSTVATCSVPVRVLSTSTRTDGLKNYKENCMRTEDGEGYSTTTVYCQVLVYRYLYGTVLVSLPYSSTCTVRLVEYSVRLYRYVTVPTSTVYVSLLITSSLLVLVLYEYSSTGFRTRTCTWQYLYSTHTVTLL